MSPWIVIAHVAVAVGLAFFIPLTLAIPALPLSLKRLHARSRIPLLVGLALSSAAFALAWTLADAMRVGAAAGWVLAQVALVVVGVRLHQDRIFRAVTAAEVEPDASRSPIPDDARVVVVSVGERARAYPLTYVAHRHIINDRIGDTRVAVTFCPACHSAIVYDTTAVGTLRVASFHEGNMVFGDERTRTWWQQATGASLIGQLHPRELPMLGFELLSWRDARASYPDVDVVRVTPRDLRPFSLPIPGLWERIMKTEFVPWLKRDSMDRRLPARELVVGVQAVDETLAWRRKEILERGLVFDPEHRLLLVAHGETVTALHVPAMDAPLSPALEGDAIVDRTTGARWSRRGRPLDDGAPPLEPVRTSEEHWYSWSRFHPGTRILDAGPDA